MSRTCTICSHPERAAIEALVVASSSNRAITRQFAVSKDAVARHKEHCMKPAFHDAIATQDTQAAFSALDEMAWMRQQARAIYAAVWTDAQAKDHRLALSSLGELRKQTELYSELTGELDRSLHLELRTSPEWANVRDILFTALTPFPEARIAVAKALLAQGMSEQAKAVS